MSASEEILSCNACGLLQRVQPLAPGTAAECSRCGLVVSERRAGTLAPAAALTLAALILYVPANVFPIMSMHFYGARTESTVWGGVVSLVDHGYWFIGAVVFVASMAVPLLKLAGLLFLVVSVRLGSPRWQRARLRLFRFIDRIGPWAMLDVFLLAVLVALVRLGDLASVLPGPGLLAFTAMVVLTILATASFDTKLIWERAARA
jgi:paraquat-inducible protein A